MKTIKLFTLLILIVGNISAQTVSVEKLITCDDRLILPVYAHGFDNIAAVSLKIKFDSEIHYDSIFDLSPRFSSGYCVYQYSVAEQSLFFSWFDPVYWFFCADTMLFFNIKCHRTTYNSIVNNIYFDQTMNYYNEIGDTSGIAVPTFFDNGFVVCDPTYIQEYHKTHNKTDNMYNIQGQIVKKNGYINKGNILIK